MISLGASNTEYAQKSTGLLSSDTSDSKSDVPEDLLIDTISRPLAICMASVFEDLTDKLVLVGSSLHTPFVDTRRQQSILLLKNFHRPLFNETNMVDEECEKWTFKQQHGSVIPNRLDYLVGTEQEKRLSVTELMKKFGIKSNTESEKNQKIRIQLQLTANSLVTELVMDATFNTLIDRIREEKREKEKCAEQYKKVYDYKNRIAELKAAVREAKNMKILEKKSQKVDFHNLKDMMLEHDLRSGFEDKYVRKLGKSKINLLRRTHGAKETLQQLVFKDMEKQLSLEKRVHESMIKIICQKLREYSECLEAIVEKYDRDFYRLNNELEALYKARKMDLERITWLQKRIVDYERIIVDNRRMQATLAEKMRKKVLENKKSIKIQAWWRGTMVRKCFGRFREIFGELHQLRAKKLEAKANRTKQSKGK